MEDKSDIVGPGMYLYFDLLKFRLDIANGFSTWD
jgi:hypothetical protein